MVIIGVEEGYRAARTVAMLEGLCRSGRVVENLWNAYFALEFVGFLPGRCGNLLFHVEHLQGAWGPG
jgi:hypothetical protein